MSQGDLYGSAARKPGKVKEKEALTLSGAPPSLTLSGLVRDIAHYGLLICTPNGFDGEHSHGLASS